MEILRRYYSLFFVKHNTPRSLICRACLSLLIVLIFIIISSNNNLFAQTKLPNFEVELASQLGAGENSAYWISTNRFGKYSLENYSGLTAINLYSQIDTGKVFDYNYGLELVSRYDGSFNPWIHQAFFQVRFFDMIAISMGLKEETIGDAFTPLSSGSILWSGNARPMPKIEIGTPGYVDVPYTRGYFEISGSLAHGWFEKDRFVENVLLHQKYIFGRAGGDLPINLSFGFMHFAQWGGFHPDHGQLPVNFDSYLRVFFAGKGDIDSPTSWQINRFGNHIGSRNYGIDIKLTGFTVRAYHQDLFEDGSGQGYENFPDGLWGAVFINTNPKAVVTAVLYEYLQTTNQSGPIHSLEERLRGDDNYFNNGQYQSGWTHHLMTIGTPFITSPAYQQSIDSPVNFRIWNNRTRVHHIAFMGNFSDQLAYKSLFSFSRNYGVFGSMLTVPEEFVFDKPRNQYSWLGELNFPLKQTNFEVGTYLGIDWGKMYGNNLSALLKVTYKFSVSKD